jgi:hypothetical protein
MATAIMNLIGNDHRASARNWMEWVGNFDLVSRTPGMMTSRRMVEPATGDRGEPGGDREAKGGVKPQAWLTDVLERTVSGQTKAHELAGLLPWT